MVNLETLKKEVYQRERKKLFWKFIFGNILLVLFLSVTWSGTKVTEREKELLLISKELKIKNDSLMELNTVGLISLKEMEGFLKNADMKVKVYRDTCQNVLIATKGASK